MKEGYRFLGEYIRQVDIRNKEGKKENLLGVSVQKQFIQSIANTVGTDFTKYKIVKKGQFTYIPDTSRRGDKIAIALLEDYEEGLVSKGDAPDIEQMNARVRKMLEGAIQSDGIEELFETGKHISVDIFSDEYMDKINAIQLPNTKIKILQRLLSQAIDEFKKVNKIMGVEFADRLKKVVDEYNNRRRDEAYANEVLDDVAEQLAQLLSELKTEKNSFKNMGIDYEEKAFYDILKAVSKKFEFEYPDDKMIELSKRIKLIVDDKSRYTDWSARDDIKANLQVDLILLLDEFGYPPVTIDDVYKEVLEQAENFKKYAQ